MHECMYVCMYVCVTQREQIMNKSQRTFFEEGSHGDGRAGFSDKVGQRGVGGRVRRHGQMVERRPRLAGRPCGGGARGARPWRTREPAPEVPQAYPAVVISCVRYPLGLLAPSP